MNDTHLKMRGIAHDINGLMARASLAAEQLAGHSDANVSASASNIVQAIDKVTEICRQELAEANSGPDCRTESAFCIEQLVQQVIEIVSVDHVSSAKDIAFLKAVEQDLKLSRHPSSLFRMLFNLTLNSARAIAKKGGSWIEIEVAQAYGKVFLEISDDGPGLPDHVLAYLYPRADGGIAPQGPIGSGLITTASLAREMGGELRLIKSTSAGTRFCVVVPQSALVSNIERRSKQPGPSRKALRQAATDAELVE